jgi:AcrR family transcriptional regulator
MRKDAPGASRTRAEAAIIDAATHVLTRDRSGSMTEIAREAGVGRATVHRYFPDRSALVTAIGQESLAATRDGLRRARVREGDVRDALQRVVEELLALGPRFGFLVNEVDVSTDPDFLAADRAAMRPVRVLLDRGRSDGSLRADLPVEWISATLEALIYTGWMTMEQNGAGLGETARMVLTSFLAGVGGP